MHTATSKLTREYQATIPEPVRALLKLEAGDTIAFDLERDVVRVRKARPLDVEYAKALQGTLQEWSSDADERAYPELDHRLVVRKMGALAGDDRSAVAQAMRKLLKACLSAGRRQRAPTPISPRHKYLIST